MIYRPWNFGFGDHWATCSFLRHIGRAAGRRQRLSTRSHGQDLGARLREIDAALAWQEWAPELVDAAPTHELDGFDVWACPPVPTHVRWAQDWRSRTVVCQFDGISAAADKNPPLAEQGRIVSWLAERGLIVLRLGKHLSVEVCVREAAQALAFVGCSSGMSCLAQSVGVPVYLYEHQLPVITCTRQKQHVIVRSADDFIAQARPYLDLCDRLRDIGRPTASA